MLSQEILPSRHEIRGAMHLLYRIGKKKFGGGRSACGRFFKLDTDRVVTALIRDRVGRKQASDGPRNKPYEVHLTFMADGTVLGNNRSFVAAGLFVP
jgi:hypothetical protein